VSCGKDLGDKSTRCIRVTEGTLMYCDYFIWVYLILWLFNLFGNVWVCVCVGFVMCGCVYVWVL